MARILIVGGGCRGRRLASEMARDGHALRVTTRTEDHRAAIEATGAECWIGTPDRLATMRAALDSVTIACWMLGTATGEAERVRALHTARLELFLTQTIDTTVRGFIYEAAGSTVPREVLAEGERIGRAMGARNAIPVAVLTADPSDAQAWLKDARAAIGGLLGG
ncbi:MAG: hypothetical protein ACHP93_03495 [Solirubrobacterales bacterium]